MEPDTPVWQIISDEWGKQGMSPHGIAGVLANVQQESNFDPALRHPDQPRFGGEAHYAHGLYQEGGDEWNNYSTWLQQNHPDGQWQDPRLQSEFAAWNLKTNYPQVWDRMNNADSPVVAGTAYAGGYLKPAAQYLQSRVQGFLRNGVPTLDDYTSGNAQYRPSIASASPAAGPPLAAGIAPAPAAAPAPQPAAASGNDPTSALASMAGTALQGEQLRPPPPLGNILPQMQPLLPAAALQLKAALLKQQQQQQQQFPPQVAQNLINDLGQS